MDVRTWLPTTGDLPPVIAKASLRDNSGPAKFDIKAEGTFEMMGTDVALTSVVYGDPQQAKVDLQTKYNTKEYGMLLEATRSSLRIDANVVKHIVVNANVSTKFNQWLKP